MKKLFGFFDYNKEGPGVYLDDPPKGPFATFFAILSRKFWKITAINMMYVLFSIPTLLVALLLGSYIFPEIIPLLKLEVLEKIFSANGVLAPSTVDENTKAIAEAANTLTPKELGALLYVEISIVLSMLLVGIQMIVLGPVHAGITHLFRNYAREEHAFIWGDFKDTVRNKWKISLVISIIGIVAFIIMSTGYTFYRDVNLIKNDFLRGILSGTIVVLFILFTIMQMYLYPLIVSFKMSLKQIYKNSFYLTMAKLPFNFAILLVTIVIIAVIPMSIMLIWGGIGLVISMFYYLFMGFGINLMLTNFYVYRQLKRFIIDPFVAESRKISQTDGDDTDNKE
jgi:uncharacterized membrane protein YesL